jgi:hypothetical protein
VALIQVESFNSIHSIQLNVHLPFKLFAVVNTTNCTTMVQHHECLDTPWVGRRCAQGLPSNSAVPVTIESDSLYRLKMSYCEHKPDWQ